MRVSGQLARSTACACLSISQNITGSKPDFSKPSSMPPMPLNSETTRQGRFLSVIHQELDEIGNASFEGTALPISFCNCFRLASGKPKKSGKN